MAILYNDDYFEDGTWISGIFENRYVDSEPKLREEARRVLGFLSAKGSILDVGCAGGTFLYEAREAGYGPVYGIELNQKMANYAREHYGAEVVCARVEDMADDHWKDLDVAVLMDTLEHIAQPLEMLQKIGGWMRSGGQLLVRGPVYAGFAGRAKEALRRTLGVVKIMPGAPRDANFFNRRSLTACMRASGFEPKQWFDAHHDFANVLAVRR